MKHFIVTTSVRHGEQVTERRNLIKDWTEELAEIEGINIECSNTGESIGDEDGDGVYGDSYEFHFSPHSVQEIDPEDVAILSKYFPIA